MKSWSWFLAVAGLNLSQSECRCDCFGFYQNDAVITALYERHQLANTFHLISGL